MHSSELTDRINVIIAQFDQLPLHPKHKVLVYSRHLLSIISWRFSVAGYSEIWVCENLYCIVLSYKNGYIPVYGILSNVILSNTKFSLMIYPPSI